MMYPTPANNAVATALVGPNALPTNVMNPPVDGCARANCASVFPSNAIATPATTIVNGAATPAVVAINPNPKKKLIAGPIFAIVAAEISTIPNAPRCNRCSSPTNPAGGLFDSDRGNGSKPLMLRPFDRRGAAPSVDEPCEPSHVREQLIG